MGTYGFYVFLHLYPSFIPSDFLKMTTVCPDTAILAHQLYYQKIFIFIIKLSDLYM